MISVSFKVNGRDVSPNRLGDAIGNVLLTAIQDGVRSHVHQRIGLLRCSVHGRAASLTAAPGGSSRDSWILTVHACCKPFEDQATRALK